MLLLVIVRIEIVIVVFVVPSRPAPLRPRQRLHRPDHRHAVNRMLIHRHEVTGGGKVVRLEGLLHAVVVVVMGNDALLL